MRVCHDFQMLANLRQRRYRVSPERLRAFAKLTPYERLKWVEECSAFVRMGQQALADRKKVAP